MLCCAIPTHALILLLLLLLLSLLLLKVGNARVGESDLHPISPTILAPQYQPIEKEKRMGKIIEDEKGASSLGQ